LKCSFAIIEALKIENLSPITLFKIRREAKEGGGTSYEWWNWRPQKWVLWPRRSWEGDLIVDAYLLILDIEFG
jgi:hypothetical protein